MFIHLLLSLEFHELTFLGILHRDIYGVYIFWVSVTKTRIYILLYNKN